MLLTDEERTRFADYLEMDATSTEGIAKQMESLPGAMPLLARKLKAEAQAARIVATKLRQTESFSVSRTGADPS